MTWYKSDAKLLLIMRDNGYDYAAPYLISKGIRGFTSDQVICRCRSVFDAAERLIPMVGKGEFQDRLIAAMRPVE